MVYLTDYFQHRRDCNRKQAERRSRIQDLPEAYRTPITAAERSIYDRPIEELVDDVHKGLTQPSDILRAYGKRATIAHQKTNCLTEIMIPNAESWFASDCNLKGPLAGLPVSLKDSLVVRGYDTSVGYSVNTSKPATEDGITVRLLKEAGAVPFVKTALPITLLSFESTTDLWGRCRNPHNSKYSPGGSTGGEGALLASGGSRIGIGSDVAGSVRAPAHWSGCYSLRCSTGRWPKGGMNTSMPGQEGIPSVFSPMARTLNDLTYFTRSMIQMRPWRLDHTVHPIEWRDTTFEEIRKKPKLRIGVLRTDGVIDPAPACARALDETVNALSRDGHDVFNVEPPLAPFEALRLASLLLNADGCKTFSSFFRTGEWNDPGAKQMQFYMNLPRFIKYPYYLYVKYVRRDSIWADLLYGWHPKTAFQQWKLVAQREAYKAQWHSWIEDLNLDAMLTPPNATPALPHDGMHDAVSSCGYTFLFNLLDYSAGIIPVTHVSAELDALPDNFSLRNLNGVARGAYKHYDSHKMAGLPVAVQVVGQRLTEERTLAVMERVESALDKWNGGRYRLLDIE